MRDITILLPFSTDTDLVLHEFRRKVAVRDCPRCLRVPSHARGPFKSSMNCFNHKMTKKKLICFFCRTQTPVYIEPRQCNKALWWELNSEKKTL